ncbi:MAG: tRNA (adenosine(37)-N6)-dimethylallyltransferase MiaA [Rhodospirillales bacterium]|nr:tRNA (adenosine(37)-N6)-dimethylallyltransferase MiaA [Rhodospirillales bacterium]
MVTKPREGKKRAVIVGGPTASGKSAAAMAIAREFDGVVINADSMQVYEELRVLSARPSAADEAAVPHRLYGVWKAAEHGTVGRWREAALAEIAAANDAGRLAVVCGGTGMYLKLLVEGLSAVPPIPADVRAASRALLAKIGPAEFFADLARRDPASGAKLRAADTQRMLRAWEVVVATGIPLSAHQAADPPRAGDWPTLLFLPPRAAQVAAIDARAERMVEQGALEEVRGLLAQGLSDELPAMRALGVRELAAHIRGETDLPSAINELKASTRKFAKRQATWFKGQVRNAKIVAAQFSESLMPEIRTFIKEIR